MVPRNRLPGKTKELVDQNRNSEVFNNIGQVTGSWIWEKPKLQPYAKADRNVDVGSEVLADPGERDLRPRAGTPVIDAGKVIGGISDRFQGEAPDLGAHEFGEGDWEAGYQGKGFQR